MSQHITFVTGNEKKFEVMSQLVHRLKLDVTLEREDIETPEIQSTSSKEVALHSAKWAALELNTAVIVTDVSYHIESLGGFPGPFIKYINLWIKPDQLLHAIGTDLPSKVFIDEHIAFCAPGREPISQMFREEAFISGIVSANDSASTIDRILVRANHDKPQADYPADEIFDIWQSNAGKYSEFLERITS